jgi:hypothetical protein
VKVVKLAQDDSAARLIKDPVAYYESVRAATYDAVVREVDAKIARRRRWRALAPKTARHARA